jgi:hypothetical protein
MATQYFFLSAIENFTWAENKYSNRLFCVKHLFFFPFCLRIEQFSCIACNFTVGLIFSGHEKISTAYLFTELCNWLQMQLIGTCEEWKIKVRNDTVRKICEQIWKHKIKREKVSGNICKRLTDRC